MIARATEGDLPEILLLQREAFQEEAEQVRDANIKPMVQTLDELREEFATFIFLKYVEDGRIVGSVRARRLDERSCYIGRLVVRPELWGKGRGTALMMAIEAAFPDVERFELFTRADHPRNRPFYARLGYHAVRTIPHSDVLTFVELEKVRAAKNPSEAEKSRCQPEE